MKDIHTTKEVVDLLVSNNNKVLKIVGDHEKYFVIEGDLVIEDDLVKDGDLVVIGNLVICKKKNIFALPHKILNTYLFDYIIEEERK